MRRRSVLQLAAASSLVGLAPEGANAATALPTGIVYVQTNARAAGANAILAYRRDVHGRLTPLWSSPFPTGGRGVGAHFVALGGYASDQNVIVDRSRRLLFTVNGGTNTIAVFRIGPTGALMPVPGSPFPCGGRNPVGVGIHGSILIVANKDADLRQSPDGRPSYTALKIRSDGNLAFMSGGKAWLPKGASPTQPLTKNAGSFVFGCQCHPGGSLDVLVAENGLARIGGDPIPPHAGALTESQRRPLGLWAHPGRRVLYVGLPVAGRLAVLSWDDAGRLTFLRSVPNAGIAICWLFGNRSGSRLYAADSDSRQISVYDTSDAANPVEIQTVTLKGKGFPKQMGIGPDGAFLHVLAEGAPPLLPSADALHVLRIDHAGLLREVSSSPTPLPIADGDRPQGVAVL